MAQETPPEASLKELRDLVAPGPGHVAEVLPDAIGIRAARDDKLGRALAPTVERAIQESVTNAPENIADAIFPVIGPAIRKSIAEALKGMMQTLNQTVEQTVSVQGLRWRLEAMRTGRPIAEVVLRHTLLFRVEHVLLVDRNSGLLIAAESSDPSVQQNADLISGMLTALRDFVRDSFGGSEAASLDSIEVGELTLQVVQGPHAILAAVVRGTPPRESLGVMHEVIEDVHSAHGPALKQFDGDPTAVTGVDRLLRRCMISQAAPRRRKASPLLWITGGLCLLALMLWAGISLWTAHELSELTAALGAEPGIVVVSAGRSGRTLVVRGLRDPLSVDPAVFAREHGIDPDRLDQRWRSYHALDPEIVLRRVSAKLQPPAGARLDIADTTLVVAGEAPRAWARSLERIVDVTPGIATLDTSALEVTEGLRLRRSVDSIRQLAVHFEPGSTTPAEPAELARVGGALTALDSAASAADCHATVTLHGHTDARGDVATNLRLSEERASRVAGAFAALDLARVRMETRPAGTLDPERAAGSTHDGRVVLFETSLDGNCP